MNKTLITNIFLIRNANGNFIVNWCLNHFSHPNSSSKFLKLCALVAKTISVKTREHLKTKEFRRWTRLHKCYHFLLKKFQLKGNGQLVVHSNHATCINLKQIINLTCSISFNALYLCSFKQIRNTLLAKVEH